MVFVNEYDKVITFVNLNEKLNKLYEWDLIPKTHKAKILSGKMELKKFRYYFVGNNEYAECDIIGFIPYPMNNGETAVVSLNSNLCKVMPLYLKDMQSPNFGISQYLHDEKIEKKRKGKSFLSILDEFTVIDLETTGFVHRYDEILEIGALKYKCGDITEFHSYVALETKQMYLKDDDYCLNIHKNINVGMLRDAPEIKDVLINLLDFIGNDVVIAHNANFDINFIYDKADKYLNIDFGNDFIDTLRLVRRLFPELPNHKLSTLCEEFNLFKPDHRSLADCYATLELYNLCKNKCVEENIDLDKYNNGKSNNRNINFISNKNKESVAQMNKIRDNEISTDGNDYCLKDKNVVFTGTLENLIRKDAAQLVINLGGSVSDNITQSTNYLVMGMQDYFRFADGKESSKTKKAKRLIEVGQDLQIIDENEFIKITSLKLQEG